METESSWRAVRPAEGITLRDHPSIAFFGGAAGAPWPTVDTESLLDPAALLHNPNVGADSRSLCSAPCFRDSPCRPPGAASAATELRSEERRVGKECSSPCR